MKQKLIGWSVRYLTALRTHLKPGQRANSPTAARLGREAVALGMETLELAQIHERSLATLIPPDASLSKKIGTIKRAGLFFSDANNPIEETHRAARQSKVRENLLTEALDQRTHELAATNRRLQRGVVRSKAAENAFAASGKHHHKCLEESLQLQKRLRQLTHRVLAAQESERTSISHELQDEIAQTLLGINVRLLSLKEAARTNHKGLKNQIASAQQLVLKSAKSVRRFARQLNIHPPK